MKIRKRELVFGEKLSHAVQVDQGFDKVIIIGNDTPGLTYNILKSPQFPTRQRSSRTIKQVFI
jgi:glycosyltransferase A (GT-A) superfamily protein (DUF2064 family)